MIICCWNCCKTIVSTSKVSIIVFYDDKRNIIINFGSSEIGHHTITANIHAEEIAMKQLRKYIIKNQLNYTKYKKHIKLIIWKNKSDIEILPAQCCSWCKSYIKICDFPLDNVITVNNESAILTISQDPFKKKEVIKKLKIKK